MSIDLTKIKCIPCEGGTPPLEKAKVSEFLTQTPGWKLSEDGIQIWNEYHFKDFRESLDFVNKVGGIAESEGHHPDILISYNRVKLTLYTHAMGGLSQNDFILAAKINQLHS